MNIVFKLKTPLVRPAINEDDNLFLRVWKTHAPRWIFVLRWKWRKLSCRHLSGKTYTIHKGTIHTVYCSDCQRKIITYRELNDEIKKLWPKDSKLP